MSPFPEEQLDSPAGYFVAQPGQTLQNGRWSIIRKLGWGPRSSAWLAVDSQDPDTIEAIKIFTVPATEDSTASNELKRLQAPPLNVPALPFPCLRDHFYEESSKGKHLCLVLHVLGRSAESLRLSNTESGAYLPLHIVKKIVVDVLEGLCELHGKKIVHGATTPSNFLFVSAQRAEDIREAISGSPASQPVEITGCDGVAYPVVRSQPIEEDEFSWNDSRDRIADSCIYLANFAYSHPVNQPAIPGAVATPESLRGGRVDLKSDIWTLGTAVYLLLTGKPLFAESSVKVYEETLPDLENLLVSSNKLSAQDIPLTVSFLKACLDIDPAARPSAFDLVGNSWVAGGQTCSCGWCAADAR